MGKHNLCKRQYGARYYPTRTIADLAVLAERFLADLPSAGTAGIPAGVEFSVHLLVDTLLQLQVGGLDDDFTFLDQLSRLYSRPANMLIVRLLRELESYNWINPEDPTDRRFFPSVYLLAESEYRSEFWTPGVVRIF